MNSSTARRRYTQAQLAAGKTRPEHTFGLEAREALLRGFDQLADLLEVTLGPAGRNVAVQRDGSHRRAPEIIRDGGVLARRVFALPDRAESMGLLLARQLAWKVEEEAGDGSTTAVVMARHMAREAHRLIAAGHDPMALRRGLDKLAQAVIAALRAQSVALDDERRVFALARAIVAHDALAKLIQECIDVVGAEGAIEVRPANGVAHDREYIQGALWNRGWESQWFVTDGGEAILLQPRVLVATHRLSTATSLAPILTKVAEHSDGKARGLVVIAYAIEGEALNLLVANKVRGGLPLLGLQVPGAGDERLDIAQDLAILCGGRLFAEEAGDDLEHATLSDLGRADEIRAVRSAFTIIGGKGKPADIRSRIADIRRLNRPDLDDADRDLLYERAGKLLGGVALLRVGGASDTEREFFKSRAEEAVRVLRAAARGGVVAGGGAALAACARALAPGRIKKLHLSDDEAVAVRLVRGALTRPMRAIVRNAGLDADALMAEHAARASKSPSVGFDVRRGEWADLLAADVVDATHVLEAAIRAAFSCAGMMLTIEALVHKPRADSRDDVQLGP